MTIHNSLDSFNEKYLCGFEIFGTHVDDITDFYALYKTSILRNIENGTSIEEVIDTIKAFKFLTQDVNVEVLKKYNIDFLYYGLYTGGRNMPEELYSFILPVTMMQAYRISKEFGLPQYPAALQYVQYCITKQEEDRKQYLEEYSKPLTEEAKAKARIKLGRKIATSILQALTDTGQSVEEIEMRLSWPTGRFFQELKKFTLGTHKGLHLFSDMCLALGREPEINLLPSDGVPHPANLLSKMDIDTFVDYNNLNRAEKND